MAKPNEISIGQGETQSLVITVRDINDALFDLTGSTLYFRVKYSHTETANLISKTNGSGIVLTDPVNGVATVTLDDTDTENLDPADYVYDFWVVDASLNQFQAINETRFTIRRRVTVI